MADWPIHASVNNYETFGGDTATSGPKKLTGLSGTDSAWVELTTSTAFSSNLLLLHAMPHNDVAMMVSFVDVAVGAPGSEQEIVRDWYHDGRTSFGLLSALSAIPISIPAGSRVVIRAKTSGDTPREIAYWGAICSSGFAGVPGASEIINETGTTFVALDAGGTANTKGGYSEVVLSTSKAFKGGFLNIGLNDNATANSYNFLLDLAIGGPGSEEIIFSNAVISSLSSEIPMPPIHIPTAIPAGTRIVARVQSSGIDASDRILSACFMGYA